MAQTGTQKEIRASSSPSIEMMRKRSEFLAARFGVRATGSALRIEAIIASKERARPRIGITVTKKNGNSVIRSRIKRRIRHAIFSHSSGDMRPGHDYVFISKPNALRVPFITLQEDIAGLIDKCNKRLDAKPNQTNS